MGGFLIGILPALIGVALVWGPIGLFYWYEAAAERRQSQRDQLAKLIELDLIRRRRKHDTMRRMRQVAEDHRRRRP